MIWAYLSTFALLFVGLLLMVVILLQRGRGGGLAGAFGGMGGQSAFGTKAGDVFTRITVVLAVIWIALAGMSIWALEKAAQGKYQQEVPQETTPTPTAPGTGAAPGGATAPSSEQPAGSGETTGAGQSSGGPASEPTSSSQSGPALQPPPSATPSTPSSDQAGGAASQTSSPEAATGSKGKSE